LWSYLGDPRLTSTLAAAAAPAADIDVGFRADTARMLRDLGYDRMQEILVPILKGPANWYWYQRICAQDLAELCGTGILVELLKDLSLPASSRGWCAYFLSAEDASKEALYLMVVVWNPYENSWVQACCVDALAKTETDGANPFMLGVLQDADADPCARIACAAHVQDQYSTDLLINGLSNDDLPEFARERCATALGEIGGAQSSEAVVAAFLKSQTPDRVRHFCLRSLEKIGDSRACEAVTAVVADDQTSDAMRQYCLKCLEKIGDAATADKLAELEEDLEEFAPLGWCYRSAITQIRARIAGQSAAT
jgi:HEAT repeat protein